jgi:hypothetical protein
MDDKLLAAARLRGKKCLTTTSRNIPDAEYRRVEAKVLLHLPQKADHAEDI